jgi:hypothetical protein
MQMSIADARALAATKIAEGNAVNAAADAAEQAGQSQVEITGVAVGQAVDDAARAQLQAAIDASDPAK